MKCLFIIVLTFAFSSQVCAQDIITKGAPGWEIKIGYYFKGEKLKRNEFKKLIHASEDSIAIRYYYRYSTPHTLGLLSLVSGGIMLVGVSLEASYGGIINDDDRVIAIAYSGLILTVTGIAVLIAASPKKAINRFNTIQQSNLKVGINQNGLGLRYNF